MASNQVIPAIFKEPVRGLAFEQASAEGQKQHGYEQQEQGCKVACDQKIGEGTFNFDLLESCLQSPEKHCCRFVLFQAAQ